MKICLLGGDTYKWLVTGFVTIFTRCVPLVEHVLLTLPEHLRASPVLIGVRVARSLTLCVCFVDRCLCAVCSSSSYGFWLLLGYLQTLLIDNWNNFQRIVLEDKHILERKVVFYIHRRWFICYDHCHDRMCFGFTYILPSLVPITTNDMS